MPVTSRSAHQQTLMLRDPEKRPLLAAPRSGGGTPEQGPLCRVCPRCPGPVAARLRQPRREPRPPAHGARAAHALSFQLKPAGTACRDPSNPCDLPEFCSGSSPHCPANVYLHDGHPCQGLGGYCYNGVCQTHEQQCVTLWGPGTCRPGPAQRAGRGPRPPPPPGAQGLPRELAPSTAGAWRALGVSRSQPEMCELLLRASRVTVLVSHDP